MRHIILALLALASTTAQAEYLGLSSGRTADMSRMPDLTVEAGILTGNIELADYLGATARVNYRVDPGLFVYGDLGSVEIGSEEGFALGAGVFYTLEGLLEDFDTAVKASYHSGDFDVFDLDVFSFEMLISGFDSFIDSGMHWYANAGLHWIDGGDSELELGIGGGLIYPLQTGEVYLGLDLVDELTAGVGYRHYLK